MRMAAQPHLISKTSDETQHFRTSTKTGVPHLIQCPSMISKIQESLDRLHLSKISLKKLKGSKLKSVRWLQKPLKTLSLKKSSFRINRTSSAQSRSKMESRSAR